MSPDANAPPPRRFKPQLVEESTTSSSSSKKPRRFAPEPISTSTHSSRKAGPEDASVPTINVEESKDTDDDPPADTPKPKRKFAVEPVSTSSRSNRKEAHELSENDQPSPLLPHEKSKNTAAEPKKERKPSRFKPQLIETASRSRRSTDTSPALLPSDKTNASPGDIPARQSQKSLHPVPPSNTPALSLSESTLLKPAAPMRQPSMKPHNNTRTNTRQHSFKVPNLPDIDSSQSGSDGPSNSPSTDDDSDTSSEGYKHRTRRRESVDEDVSGYLLALAARAAEKQLREQEAAAFPTTNYHEPVAHYVNRSDSDESARPAPIIPPRKADKTWRDSGDEHVELQEMRKHGERLYAQGKGSQITNKEDWTGKSPVAPISGPDETPRKYIGGYQKCPDLKQMRKAASPPMLGGDIDFPRCASPENARFDVTQGADYLRKNMCYLTEQSEAKSGLWNNYQESQKAPEKAPEKATGLFSKPQNDKDGEAAKCLWGGFCNAKVEEKAPAPMGLVTPMRTPLATPRGEREDPFSSVFSKVADSNAIAPTRTSGVAPPTPPASMSPPKKQQAQHVTMASAMVIQTRLEIEARLDEEFNDEFVSQVYNYLSFGFPALARKYDEELSRVAKYSISDLRKRDQSNGPTGYVHVREAEDDEDDQDVEEPACRRWHALRTYVREWGRQMIAKEGVVGAGRWGVDGYDPLRAWGLPARRGSWGN